MHTERLMLRPYQLSDVQVLLPILSDPKTMKFWPHPFTLYQVQNWVNRNCHSYETDGFSRYVVLLKSTKTVIGDCGILRGITAGEVVNDLGYIIHHPYWGCGYATEAASAIADYGLNQLNLGYINANMPWNHRGSRRVAEKIGMEKIGEFNNPINRNILTLIYKIIDN